MSEVPFRILVVCTGNVCRSPLLELLLRRALVNRADIVVESAGTDALPGRPMDQAMALEARRFGITSAAVESHVSARLEEHIVERADLVLGMTRQHRAAVARLLPRAVSCSFTALEFARLVPSVGTERVAALELGELVNEIADLRGGRQPARPETDDLEDPFRLADADYGRAADHIATLAEAVAVALEATRPATVRRGADVADVAERVNRLDLALHFPLVP